MKVSSLWTQPLDAYRKISHIRFCFVSSLSWWKSALNLATESWKILWWECASESQPHLESDRPVRVHGGLQELTSAQIPEEHQTWDISYNSPITKKMIHLCLFLWWGCFLWRKHCGCHTQSCERGFFSQTAILHQFSCFKNNHSVYIAISEREWVKVEEWISPVGFSSQGDPCVLYFLLHTWPLDSSM